MRIIQLVILISSVYNSLQHNEDELMKLLPESLINATRKIKPHPDVGKDIYQLLHDYGYPVETHYVFTEDGYVLRMQRIPNGKNMVDTEKTKPAVLLMHGLLSGSADWLIMGPNKSLGYMLADAGFDVWLGNSRGSTWSRNHLKLDPTVDAKKFWDFSFEDCGHYDLPATIDHIIEKTGQDRIFYIGHSQGTSQYFAMASLRPEYNDKIALMTALAPVAYLGHLSSPWMRFAMKYMDILSTVADILNINEFLGHSELITLVSKLACSDGSPLQEICATFLFSVCGFDSEELDRDVERLASEMPNVVKKKVMEFEKFNHVDFIMAKHIDELLNNEVVEFMREYLSE
ncbi:lipase member K isoform X2 [Leptinotarsa decemlineata]|uniref:lipase member K isoform X2 n=1 Tax=Leptinotarsa decemlineata TaxID=7539 RepID=UPI003D3089B4